MVLGSGRSPGEENGNPLQYSCLENPMDRGAWWATVHGVTTSQTWVSNFTFFSFTLPNLPLFTPCTPHFTWKGKKCRMKGWTTHWGWIFTPFLSLLTTLPNSELVGTNRCNSPWLIVRTISICYLFKWAKWVIVSGQNHWEHKESSAVLISGWNLLVERSCLQRARRVVLRIQMSWSATQITQPWPDLRSTTHSSFLFCFLNISFYYLFTLAVLGLCCCTRASLQLQKAELLLLWCGGFSLRWPFLLKSVGSRVHGLSSCDPWPPECWLGICGVPALVVVTCGLSSFGSKAPEHRLSSYGALAYLLCSGIFPDQEWNPCPLHCKVDS